MAVITKIEQLENRVRVHYDLKTPDGRPQKRGTRDVFHKDILNLPKEPKLPENSGGAFNYTEYWGESIDVPKVGATIAFHFVENQETARQREQDFQGGPYLRN